MMAQKLAALHQSQVDARESKRLEMREKLRKAGLLEFVDAARDTFGADTSLAYVEFADGTTIGESPKRGIFVEDMVLLDWERKEAARLEAMKSRGKGKHQPGDDR